MLLKNKLREYYSFRDFINDNLQTIKDWYLLKYGYKFKRSNAVINNLINYAGSDLEAIERVLDTQKEKYTVLYNESANLIWVVQICD